MIASRGELLLALLFFTLLALVFSWPLAQNLSEQIPVSNPPQDAMHLLYGVNWGAQAIGDNPFNYFKATFFYPYERPLAFMDHMFGLAILTAPVNWMTGNMLIGFNVTWLLTFALSGLGAYLLTRYLTESVPAALVAGVLFAFHPFRYHNLGQINVLAAMWIPFALLSLHLWVETRHRRQLFLFVAFSFLQFLSSGYTGVFLMLCAVLYFIVLLVMKRGSTLGLLRSQRWVFLAAISMGFLASVPFLTPYLENMRSDIGLERTLGDTALFSADPVDFVTPAPGSLLFSAAPWSEKARHALFPGVLALVLVGAWVLLRGWKGHAHKPEMIFYALLVLAGSVLALGPLLGGSDGKLPLPFALFYYVFPGVSFIRAPVRFAILASLGIAVLAGAGLARMQGVERRPRRLRSAGAYGLVLLAGVELISVPISLLSPMGGSIPEAYWWLGSVSGSLAIVELPMPADEAGETVEHARYQLYSLIHKKRLADGVAAFVPPITRELRKEMQQFPSDAAVARLRDLGITYVLVHTDAYPAEVVASMRQAVESQAGLKFVDDNDPIWILDVVADVPGTALDSGKPASSK